MTRTWLMREYEDDDRHFDPPDPTARCLNCGALMFVLDGCERCDHADEYEVA